jgi:hypothetical protein
MEVLEQVVLAVPLFLPAVSLMAQWELPPPQLLPALLAKEMILEPRTAPQG